MLRAEVDPPGVGNVVLGPSVVTLLAWLRISQWFVADLERVAATSSLLVAWRMVMVMVMVMVMLYLVNSVEHKAHHHQTDTETREK